MAKAITNNGEIVEVDDNVMGVWELNRSVINQLALRDKSARVLHQLVTREEEKAKKEREAAKREDREEAKDIMLHVFKSPKGTYSFKNDHDEKVVIDDSK